MMKKQYEAPSIDLLLLKTSDFLSASGDATEADGYDKENYPYGETFS